MSRSRAWLSGRIIAPLAAMAVLIGLLALAGPAQAAFPGANGKIAFVYARPGDVGAYIYTVNPDGTSFGLLTGGRVFCGAELCSTNFGPSWSADGSKVAFTYERPECILACESEREYFDVYIANSDGSGLRRLNTGSNDEFNPSWSPDGTQIALASIAEYVEFPPPWYTPAPPCICIVDASTGQVVRRLTASGNDPAWSPDGGKIAYTAGRGDNTEIYVVSASGGPPVQLTSNGVPDHGPSWSPDGAKIAFYSNRDDPSPTTCATTPPYTCNWEIYTMNADGRDVTRITNNSAVDASPAWSPDGRRISFARDAMVRTMKLDGSDDRPVASGRSPDWQPIPNRPPDCSDVTATPSLLSPADRSLRLVSLGGATDPDGDTVSLTITGVTQDEPLTGDGDTTGQDAFSKYFTSDPNLASLLENKRDEVYLRAESAKHGDGRVYRIAFTGSDGRGGTCSSTATVAVASKKGLTVDSAPPSYNSFGQ